MNGSVMPLAGSSRTATPMLMIAWTPKMQASPAPAMRMNGSRSRVSRARERITIVA